MIDVREQSLVDTNLDNINQTSKNNLNIVPKKLQIHSLESKSNFTLQNLKTLNTYDDRDDPVDDSHYEERVYQKLFGDLQERKVAAADVLLKQTDKLVSNMKSKKLGVFFGVYLPTIQHIFGVLMFVRMAWMVGNAGIYQTWIIVFICCIATLTTAISMSAIATNGLVKAGGSYFMISANLGVQVGATIGICFFLANTFAVNLYVLGGVEMLLSYLAPNLVLFGNLADHLSLKNDMRFYGTIIILALAIVVAIGVRFVQLFAPISLFCVICAVFSIFIGAFVSIKNPPKYQICLLGERLLDYSLGKNCNITEIQSAYCLNDFNDTSPDCKYFRNNDIYHVDAIPGMSTSVFTTNVDEDYVKKLKKSSRYEVGTDIKTTFFILIAIYFPSVTGILTGSNLSGDLRDPQSSIPIGTISAQLTCSFVYLSLVLIFGTSIRHELLRDKTGNSLHHQLVSATLAWPHQMVTVIGAFCSTIGAALQCLCSAPRLLHAIAKDDFLPILRIFKPVSKHGEPLRALLFTVLLALIGNLAAALESVAPLIDVYFLVCYLFVNLACAINGIMKFPHWRPRFKYYHWSLSLVGAILNIILIFTVEWYYWLLALTLGGTVFIYIWFASGQESWGHATTGVLLSIAQRSLFTTIDSQLHIKNWRPQMLIFYKLDYSTLTPKYPRSFSLASQLKAGNGFTISVTMLEGDVIVMKEKLTIAQKIVRQNMLNENLNGFNKVLATKNLEEAVNTVLQTVGLGNLKQNTVMIIWPENWQTDINHENSLVFIETLRLANAKQLAIIVPVGINTFPNNTTIMTGTIDIWWILHDGGMLLLISFLLKQHLVWKNCQIRLITVTLTPTTKGDNYLQDLRERIEKYLYDIRIDATVILQEIPIETLDAYVNVSADKAKNVTLVEHNIENGISISHKLQNMVATHNHAAELDSAILENFVNEKQETASSTSNKNQKTETSDDSTTRWRMNMARKINLYILKRSNDASLIIMNIPTPPHLQIVNINVIKTYMRYLDTLTANLKSVLLVHGSGREVVTNLQ